MKVVSPIGTLLDEAVALNAFLIERKELKNCGMLLIGCVPRQSVPDKNAPNDSLTSLPGDSRRRAWRRNPRCLRQPETVKSPLMGKANIARFVIGPSKHMQTPNLEIGMVFRIRSR